MRRALAPTLVLVVLGTPVVAQQSASIRLTPMDVFNLEFVQDPQVSPDGRSVVYVRQFSDVMKDQNFSNLWIVGSDGSGNRPLTTGDFHDTTPRWSPDGTRLAYISDRDGTPQVTLRWMDTGQTATLTSLTEPPSGLEWSPDGTRLAFAKRVPEAPLVIGTMPTPPPGAEWAPPAKYTDDLVFRFNGVGEIPPGPTHLFVLPAEGGTARQVTHGDNSFGGGFWGAGSFTWDADGRHLLVTANLREESELETRDTEIYRVSVADGSFTALTDRRGPDNGPAVSPDGRWIAYTGYDDRYQGHQGTLLYVMASDGSGARSISSHLDRSIEGVRWAPDGRGVYATFTDQGDPKLALFSLSGSHEVVAQGLGSGRSSYSGAGSFSVASDGTLAFTVNGPHRPGDVAVARRGGATRIVTDVNGDVLGGKELGAVEELWWASSKDGRRIHGWIITPPGFDPSRKYPLILEIHGGPFAAYGDGFDVEKQMMAAEGFVVLYTNPRGSTSYGEEFGNLIHHAYPGDDFYDLNSGVDAVIARGYVDESNLFVTGGSGGGVLTAWMVGNTDRFNAALAFYPVINWYSFTLTADMAPVSARYWFPGMPWDNVDHYESRSLLSVVEKVKTPTLIMTGEEDWRTPMSESEQYYKALKMLGVETVLVRVPGEAHGIWGRPSHGISKMTTLKGWFDRYRKPQRPVS
ncbi:MAG: acyl-peptide hydrolase [Gemmatimonadota bacterium]